MTARASSEPESAEAELAAALFAIDPVGTAGVVLRSAWGPARDRWLARLQAMLPPEAPARRMPPNVTDDRLLGGLDLAATLQARRPIVERGLLAEADGGLVVVPMAERLAPSAVAHLAATLDLACVVVERDGITARPPARIGLVALDEGMSDDEGVAAALQDRLAFHVSLPGGTAAIPDAAPDLAAILRARQRLADVTCGDRIVEALCEAALVMGVASLRAPLLALQVARASAALHGRVCVEDADAVTACRLVLVPRATRPPPDASPPQEQEERPDDSQERPQTDGDEDRESSPQTEQPLVDMILAAARAAMPAQILARLQSSRPGSVRTPTPGKAGATAASMRRGRPAGIRRGDPGGRSRINVIETLRAAAPWQGLRRGANEPSRLEIRRADFRITRFKQHAATTTIFVVDASGSSAANRLAEAKGAVEMLLADCYVRRDEVALIAFRGRAAEVILPPTRSLVRAKRCLAGLPAGGGTPLATAIDMASTMAGAILRKGQSPVVVLLTDGKANMTRAGAPGAAQAEQEAIAAARSLPHCWPENAGRRYLASSPAPGRAARPRHGRAVSAPALRGLERALQCHPVVGGERSRAMKGRLPDLPPAVSGERRDLPSAAGRLSYYVAGPAGGGRPLLLIHSINAAGSAYEVKPLYEHYSRTRPVYALELPGFGFSDRPDGEYTPQRMTGAIRAMVEEISHRQGTAAIDALALSLSSEFLARAAVETPRAFRSLALISPSGFSQRGPRYDPPGTTRGRPGMLRFLKFPLWNRLLYRLLTTRPSIRYFLRRTWGSKNIDQGLADYDFVTARQPGARHAPYFFVSGFLFSGDIGGIYDRLEVPTWLVHGVRGDFVDYTYAATVEQRPNWLLQVFPTGALPYFEEPEAFVSAYDAFLAREP